MTIEAQIQYALKQALVEALEDIGYSIAVHATKLDDAPTSETEAEVYPVVVINTGTPVPAGHKSRIIEIAAEVDVMSYIPDDLKLSKLSEIAEIVFDTMHGIEDWSEYEITGKTVEINAVEITAGAVPGIDGLKMVQTTSLAVHVNILAL